MELYPPTPAIFNNDEDVIDWIYPKNSFKRVSDLMKPTDLNYDLPW